MVTSAFVKFYQKSKFITMYVMTFNTELTDMAIDIAALIFMIRFVFSPTSLIPFVFLTNFLKSRKEYPERISYIESVTNKLPI